MRRHPEPAISEKNNERTKHTKTKTNIIHLALALSNVLILELVRGDVPWRRELVDASLGTVNGWVDPPTRPGIGVELVEDVAAAHPGTSPPPHLAFAPDGSLLDW